MSSYKLAGGNISNSTIEINANPPASGIFKADLELRSLTTKLAKVIIKILVIYEIMKFRKEKSVEKYIKKTKSPEPII